MSGGIIYLVTCRATGKCYVGQTVRTLARRWSQHQYQKKNRANSALHAAIHKHGAGSFDLSVLEEVPRVVDLNARESHWAGRFRSLAPDGYNLKVGNGHTVTVSDETRAKIGAAAERGWSVPETRTRHLRAIMESQHRPDVVARKSAGSKLSWSRQDERERRVSALRTAVSSPKERARRRAQQTPEVRDKTAALMRARWADPVWRAERTQMFRDAAKKRT